MKMLVYLLPLFVTCGVPLHGAATASKAEATLDLGESENGLEKETWEKTEKLLGGQGGVSGLDAYLKVFPHGTHAGRARLERGRRQENLLAAREDFQEAASTQGNAGWNAQGFLELGKLEYSLGRYQEAGQALDSLFSVSKTPEPEAHFWRGQARFMSANYSAGWADFEACQKVECPAALLPLAVLGGADCQAALGNTVAALQAYQSLWKTGSPAAAQALWQAASLRERLGSKTEAYKCLEMLAARYPESFEGLKAQEKLKAEPPPAPVKEAPAPAALKTVSPGEDQAGDGGEKESSLAYTVQVGSYTSGGWADKLVRQLKKKKYPAGKKVVRVRGHAFHEVRVGRFATRAQAVAAGRRLAKKEGLPFVVKSIE